MQGDVEGERDIQAPEPLKAHAFRPFVGSAVRFEGSDVVLTLADVEPHGRPSSAASVEGFTLIFTGPAASDRFGRGLLPEGPHRCSFGDGAATYDIYVAPIHTPGGVRQDYQAVFN